LAPSYYPHRSMTITRILVFAFCILLTCAAHGRGVGFEKATSNGGPGMDMGRSMTTDHLGNVYSVGWFEDTVDFDPGVGVQNAISVGGRDIFIQKLDSDLNLLWIFTIGGTGDEHAYGIDLVKDGSGAIVITGDFNGLVDFDPGLGTHLLSSQSSPDCFVLQLDANGNFVWAKAFGGTSSDNARAVYVDSFSNVIVTGGFTYTVDFDPSPTGVFELTAVSNFDIFILKLDATGNFRWAVSFGDLIEIDIAQCVKVDGTGNVYISGVFQGTVDFDPGPGIANLTSNGYYDAVVLKLDSSGGYHWARSFGAAINDYAESVCIDQSGAVIVTGQFRGTVDFDPGFGTHIVSSGTNSNAYVWKLTAAGNFAWVRTIGSNSSFGESVAVDNAGFIYSSGRFSGVADFDPGPDTFLQSASSSDVYIQTLDPQGNFVWAGSFVGTAYSHGASIAIGAAGEVIVCGDFEGTVDFDPGPLVHSLTSNGFEDAFVVKLAPCLSTAGIDHITACGSLTWIDGMTYYSNNNAATHTFPCGAANGCDSIVQLDLTVLSSATGVDTHTACSSFTWIDGATYINDNNTATYTYSGAAANGCDSIVTLNLAMLAASGVDIQYACNSFTWIDSLTYTSSNSTATHVFVGGAANGCDSTVTLNLTIYSPPAIDLQSACDSFTWVDGITYFASNFTATHTFVGGGSNGCDSTVSLNLTLNNSTTGVEYHIACDSFTWVDGITYFASNFTATHTFVGGGSNGCDITVSLNLTLYNSTTGVEYHIACDSFTWVDGITYFASNFTATHTFIGGGSNGCDSTASLNLTLYNSTTGVEYHTACDSFTWVNGITYTSSNNTASHIMPGGGVTGCDSTVFLDLLIMNAAYGTDAITACDSFTWIDGITYTSNNNTATYTLSGAANNGCDSIVLLNFTVIQSTVTIDQHTACRLFTWIDGLVYTESNSNATYTYTGASSNGCDSIVQLDLTILQVDTNVAVADPTITAQAAGAAYQWLDCNNNYAPIQGASAQAFTPTSNGYYAVELTENGCVDTSACYSIILAGVAPEAEEDFRVYPNPTQGAIFIDLGRVFSNTSITIRNQLSQLVFSTELRNAQSGYLYFDGAAGVYFVEIKTGTRPVRYVRILKH
jgi:hypothetical protein